jgi:hypothetical protein
MLGKWTSGFSSCNLLCESHAVISGTEDYNNIHFTNLHCKVDGGWGAYVHMLGQHTMTGFANCNLQYVSHVDTAHKMGFTNVLCKVGPHAHGTETHRQ